MTSGAALLAEIDREPALHPRLWWLGHAGFAIKYRHMVVYVDPYLSGPGALLDPAEITHADLILSTHPHPHHLDADTVRPMLAASPRAKLVLPKSAAEAARALGIPYERMTTTDAGLRIEYFRLGEYLRIYAVPSAHPELAHTPLGGYPYLGYLIRCGGCTIYHAGDGVPYDTLADRLKPYTVSLALLPFDGRENGNLTVAEAAQLSEAIGAHWLAPMHYGLLPNTPADASSFVDHLLFHCPAQRFKVFAPGEGWSLPED